MFWLDRDREQMAAKAFAKDMKGDDNVTSKDASQTESMKEDLQEMAHKAGRYMRDLADSGSSLIFAGKLQARSV